MKSINGYSAYDFINSYMGDYIAQILPQGAQTTLANAWATIEANPNLHNMFNAGLASLIGRTVAEADAGFENPLGRFEGDVMPFGATIESIFVDVVDPQNFDANDGNDNPFVQNKQDLSVLFHTISYRLQYTATITNDQLRDAFLSENGLQRLVDAQIKALYNSKEFTDYDLEKDCLQHDISGAQISVYDEVDANVYVNFVEAVKVASDGMIYPSRAYNQLGRKRTTPKSRQALIIDSAFKNKIDVNLFSSVYNMRELEARGLEIIPIDGFDSEQGLVAVLVDTDGFEWHNQLMTSNEIYNPKKHYSNIFLDHWGMKSFKLYCNCVKFYTTDADKSITVSVTGSQSTAPAGGFTKDGKVIEYLSGSYKAFDGEYLTIVQPDNWTASSVEYKVTGVTVDGAAVAFGTRIKVSANTTISLATAAA